MKTFKEIKEYAESQGYSVFDVTDEDGIPVSLSMAIIGFSNEEALQQLKLHIEDQAAIEVHPMLFKKNEEDDAISCVGYDDDLSDKALKGDDLYYYDGDGAMIYRGLLL